MIAGGGLVIAPLCQPGLALALSAHFARLHPDPSTASWKGNHGGCPCVCGAKEERVMATRYFTYKDAMTCLGSSVQ